MKEMEYVELYPEEMDIRLSGRTLCRDRALYLLHAASFIEFDFEGRHLELEMESEGGGDDFKAWIGFYVNDMDDVYRRIPLNKGRRRYLLWEGDKAERVRLRIVKLSENQYAYTAITRLITDSKAVIKRTEEKKKRIEFIGDSITCGFGNEGNAGDEFTTGTENPMKAYGALTAKKLDCEFNLVAWSGIGIISSWIPPEEEVPNTGVLVPKVYPYVDYGLFSKMGWSPNEKYDYEKDCCDAIVVNLGTNDASYTRDSSKHIHEFQEAYRDFLRYLRLTHKNIPIICVSGAMTELLCDEIKAAVETLRDTDNDDRIYYLRFAGPETEDGEGAVGHPSVRRHEKMAQQLSDWIRDNKVLS